MFDGAKGIPDAFPALVDSAVAEDIQRVPRRPGFHRMKYFRIDAPRRLKTADFMLPLQAPANALGIPEKIIISPGDGLFHFVAFEDKIEKLGPGPKPVKLGKDGIFAAEPDIKFFVVQRIKRPDGALKSQPARRLPLGVEKDIAMAPLDELVADLDIAADSAKNLDMRQQSGDFHGLLALFIGTISKNQNYSNKIRRPKEEMLKKRSELLSFSI
jgi:hypothetical protein